MAKNLNTVFPFYDDVDELYKFREDVEDTPCLIASQTTLLPFVIRIYHNSHALSETKIDLYDNDTDDAMTGYTWDGDDFGLAVSSGTTYDYIYFAGTTISAPSLPTGCFYLKFSHPDLTLYSESFMVLDGVSDYIKLDFSNNTQLANIMPYFYQTLYVDATLKTPEYVREDTGDKNNGILVREKQVVMKSNSLRVLLAPEYVVDALMLLPLMDNVIVTTQDGVVNTYDEIRLKDPEWAETTHGTRSKLEFQLLKTIAIKKLNFKEMGYTTETSATIKGDSGVTALHGGSVYYLQVTFDEAMPTANYIPSVPVCYGSSAPFSTEIPSIGNILTTGFTIYTSVACNVRWLAILP